MGLEEGLRSGADAAGVALTLNRAGSMLGAFFCEGPVRNFEEARKTDTRLYGRFFWKMLGAGAYLPPSAFETVFVSLAHTEADVAQTVRSAARSLGGLKK